MNLAILLAKIKADFPHTKQHKIVLVPGGGWVQLYELTEQGGETVRVFMASYPMESTLRYIRQN